MYLHTLEPHPGSANWPGFEPAHRPTPKDTYSWFLYKLGPDWAFNHYPHQKFDELLTCGTEKCLDWWYEKLSGKKANWSSEMFSTWSRRELDDYTTKLEPLGPDETRYGSHYYLDKHSGERLWLCSYGTDLGLGGTDPLYLKLTLTNPG